MDNFHWFEMVAKAVLLVSLVSGLPLLASMCVGFVVSVFQAATQIQEQTLSFIPRLLAVVGSLFIFGSWMMRELVAFMDAALSQVGALSRSMM